MLPQMDTKVSLAVKVLWKFISLICFRVYLEVDVHKNPTCFSRWSVSDSEGVKHYVESIGGSIGVDSFFVGFDSVSNIVDNTTDPAEMETGILQDNVYVFSDRCRIGLWSSFSYNIYLQISKGSVIISIEGNGDIGVSPLPQTET